MAFTVTISANQRSFLLGDTFKITSKITSDDETPVPSEGISYAWKLNNAETGDDAAELQFRGATSEIAGNYKVVVTLPDQSTIESNVLKINENHLIVNINKPSQYVSDGEEFTASAVVTYALGESPSPSYTLHYQWSKNGTEIESKTSDTLTIDSFNVADIGEYSIKVWGESKQSTDTHVIDLGHFKPNVKTELVLEHTVALGKTIVLPFEVNPILSGVSDKLPQVKTKYTWFLQRDGGRVTEIGNSDGESTLGFVVMPNGYLHKESATTDDTANYWCIAEYTQILDQDRVSSLGETGSHHCSLSIVESLYKMHRYVHPIPWRKTSFMYVGWWVFDHIVAINEAGHDWRDPAIFEDSKYATDIETVAAAEEKYGDCTLMESRNGFMYNASKLHHLDRATLERVLRIRETPPA